MDITKIADLLRATIDPKQRELAEKQLDEIRKIIGVTPAVLQVVMNGNIEDPVRQAAAIYLKNAVVMNWEEKEVTPGQPLEFHIHEQDKATIRDSIVDAAVLSPDMLRVHLGTVIHNIVKYDFPGKWTGIVDKIGLYLSMERHCWTGALLALYQLVKNFEYKSSDDRAPLDEAMVMILPVLREKMCQLLPDDSTESLLLQKQILKTLYAFLQYQFPLKLLTKEIFLQWMEIIKQVVERPVPDRVNLVDVDERAQEPAWKCKKWSLHILARVFERYGSPGTAHKEYKEFADWYIKTFSAGIITALLKILEYQGNKVYVAPRVLQQTLNYLSTAVHHAFSWKIVKQHMNLIVQNILFPLLCYTDEDQELWETDPQEYIRMKFDVFEDYVSPVTAAQTLLHTCCKKRKDMLDKTLQFVVQVLSSPTSEARMKDGALHMVGSVADILLKKTHYKEQVEQMLASYVFPHFESPNGYLRARACWVLHYFADTRFQNEQNLYTAIQLIQKCLLHEQDLPVKVEAAICLQALVTSQERVQKILEPNVTQIALELIKVIRETENEDLTNVMQKLVCLYTDQLVPIALEMTQSLAHVFDQLLKSNDDDSEDKALTAMGLLNTIDTILTMMDDQRDVMVQIEPIVIQIIVNIFQIEMIDLYEEALNLVCTISTNAISPDLWKVFEIMYQVFNKDGFDYFTEMMPSLHNFVIVDPEAFLSNQNHILAMFHMCKTVMNSEAGEDAETHAAKLLECMILQFKGRIDSCIHPFVELVLTRLTREVATSELRTMCLQVIIAALYYNPDLLMQTLDKLQPANSNQSLFAHFVKQWLDDTHCFQGLHDRKIAVLGLVQLMTVPGDKRHPIINEMVSQLLPSALLLFEGLKVAYQQKANADNQSESDDGEDDDYDPDSDPEDLEDDEDHIPATIEDIEEEILSDAETDSCDDEFEQTALESYTTPLDSDDCPIDEYVEFKAVLENIQNTDPNWFNALMSPLNNQQRKSLNDVYTLALQRKNAADSKKIEQSGGYSFATPAVPLTFDFGGNFGGPSVRPKCITDLELTGRVQTMFAARWKESEDESAASSASILSGNKQKL